MANIDRKLKDMLSNNPENTLDILVVIDDGVDVNKLPINKPKRVMDSIYQSSMKGKDILDILDNNNIVSVELDRKMNILL